MLDKILHFIKYNNAAVIILAIALILGGGVLAAGPENIGQKQTRIEGVDNTALLAADLENFNMDFKIENIEQDEKYYYAAYSYLDLLVLDGAWQYQLNSKTQKVSKKSKKDVGEYMAKFLAKHYEARMRDLKREKKQAESQGEQKRIEVSDYSGLIGKTLNLAAAVFPGYEPVVKRELPTPDFNIPNYDSPEIPAADNLEQIYNDYVEAHPEIFSASSTAPEIQTQETASSTPEIAEPESAEVVELPELAQDVPEENIAPAESAPAETPAAENAMPAEAEPENEPLPETETETETAIEIE